MLRLLGIHSARGMNFWSRCPVIRMDIAVEEFDDISSTDVPGLREALLDALPGLRDHHCSIGAPGGFVRRLRRGTYAPHIMEHVALELQAMVGHDVGYGKTRGGDRPGQYTLVFEYVHEQVGLRAGAIAFEIVQRAFAGTLSSIDAAVAELRALLGTEDSPPLTAHVLCGITGGALRHETQVAISGAVAGLAGRAAADAGLPGLPSLSGADDGHRVVVDVAPAYLLRAGLPYARSRMAVLLDAAPSDVAPRYQEPDRARQLVGTLVDGVRRDGFVICPAKEWELQDYARDRGRRVAIFAPDADVARSDRHVAVAVGMVVGGRIVVEDDGNEVESHPLDAHAPVVPQVVAALAAALLVREHAEAREGERAGAPA